MGGDGNQLLLSMHNTRGWDLVIDGERKGLKSEESTLLLGGTGYTKENAADQMKTAKRLAS